MSDPNNQHLIDSVKGVVEVGGPKEFNGFVHELNNMSFDQLKAIAPAITDISRAEHAANPSLPTLEIHGGGSGDGKGHSEEDLEVNLVKPDGKEKLVYERGLITDNGKITGEIFHPGSDKEPGFNVVDVRTPAHKPGQ